MKDKEKLLKAIYDKYPHWAFKTSDIYHFGGQGFIPINRRWRNARQLRTEGYLKRITDETEKARFGHFGKEDSYMLTDIGREKAKGLGQGVLF